MKVAIIGGHGKVAIRLTKILNRKDGYEIISIIRDAGQASDVQQAGATPVVMSLEDHDKTDFASVFEGNDLVYFCAGAGGRGGEERTKKVDYEGAVKVFDALELVASPKPRLILVSVIDCRNPDVIPKHYNDEDIATSQLYRRIIPFFMHWKYEADKELVSRTAFDWTIIRPSQITTSPGVGRASIGRTRITKSVSADDVALVLALLAEWRSAAGLAIDVVGGDDEIGCALEKNIRRGETDFFA